MHHYVLATEGWRHILIIISQMRNLEPQNRAGYPVHRISIGFHNSLNNLISAVESHPQSLLMQKTTVAAP